MTVWLSVCLAVCDELLTYFFNTFFLDPTDAGTRIEVYAPGVCTMILELM